MFLALLNWCHCSRISNQSRGKAQALQLGIRRRYHKWRRLYHSFQHRCQFHERRNSIRCWIHPSDCGKFRRTWTTVNRRWNCRWPCLFVFTQENSNFDKIACQRMCHDIRLRLTILHYSWARTHLWNHYVIDKRSRHGKLCVVQPFTSRQVELDCNFPVCRIHRWRIRLLIPWPDFLLLQGFHVVNGAHRCRRNRHPDWSLPWHFRAHWVLEDFRIWKE